VVVGVGVGVGVTFDVRVTVGVGVGVRVEFGVPVTVGVGVIVGVGVGVGNGKFFIGKTTEFVHVPIDSIFNEVTPKGMFCTTNGVSDTIVTGDAFNGVLGHELPTQPYMLYVGPLLSPVLTIIVALKLIFNKYHFFILF
jgi:hypothetical protein